MKMDIEQFNPKVEELNEIVAKSQAVDTSDLVAVKEALKPVKGARIDVKKTGKGMRDEANAYNKAVLKLEKSLLAIVEPEEERLKGILEEAEHQKMLAERKQKMPLRLKELELLEINDMTEDDLMEMDDEEFNDRKLAILSEREEAKKAKRDEERRIEDAKREAVKEEQQRVEREKMIEDDRKQREAIEAQKESERKQANINFQKFLTDNNYDKSSDKLMEDRATGVFTIYRRVASYNPKQ